MSGLRPLSRLEHAVLGLVWRGQPCTAYWVRQQFKVSPSAYFSGSAGAVYPALERLHGRNLVASASRDRGSRSSQHYSLTGSGLAALRDWLTPPLPDDDVTFSVDPLRTRVYSLGAVEPEVRLAFVREALARTRAYAAVVRTDCEARADTGDAWLHAGARGVLRETEARIAWLEELLGGLERDPDSPLGS